MKLIGSIGGGIGKTVLFTAVAKAIKKAYPNPEDELIILNAFPEVFTRNTNVAKALNMEYELAYFYQHYLKNEVKEPKFMLHDPYLQTAFILGKGHLIKVWCDMWGVPYDGELPEVFISNNERKQALHGFATNKPGFVIQTNGGAYSKDKPYQNSWPRDLPISIAQKVVNEFKKTHNIFHIRRSDQLQLEHTISVTSNFRMLAALIEMSQLRLFIDGFAQHTAAALRKPSVVWWVVNKPAQFGYDMHHNIVANPPTGTINYKKALFTTQSIAGDDEDFPYINEEDMIDAGVIIDALREQLHPPKKNDSTYERFKVKEQIFADSKKGSMVATRLAHLDGIADLTNVKQILDIGSWHLGQSIEFVSIFPDAKIDAFEPVPNSYDLCMDNRNKLDDVHKNRIHIHNFALSHCTGELPFFIIDEAKSSVPNIGASSMFPFIDGLNGTHFGQNLVQEEIRVKTDTLDNWCAANNITAIDIMWVDVQGAELYVFMGAVNILKYTNIIMTEVGLKPYYEGHTLKSDIDKFLSDLGFIELKNSFEINIPEYEANTIYVRKN